MPRSEPVAVHGIGHIDHRHGPALDPPPAPGTIKPAAPHFDITPEVFRQFMSYGSVQPPRHTAQSPPWHGLSSTTTHLTSNYLPTSDLAHETDQRQAALRRTIRGMPRMKTPTDASVHGLSTRTAASNQSKVQTPDTSVAPGDALVSAGQPPSLPQTLAQHFQQLQVSTNEPTRTTQMTPQLGPPGLTGQYNSEYQPFRFPSLPTNLIDDGFHYRQRAAQFILLYSQQASREQLSRCSRLSLPSVRDASMLPGFSRTSRQVVADKGLRQHGMEPLSCSAPDDDEEDSAHSHHHAHTGTDDENGYLDFDACRTAHLGNKKKRKSSRFSSPGLASLGNAEQARPSTVVSLPTKCASSPRVSDSSTTISDAHNGQTPALAERTNTVHHRPPVAPIIAAAKYADDVFTSSESSSGRRHAFACLPPRQTRGERQRSIARKRIRARLAPILERRRLDRLREQAVIKRGYHTSQEPHDAPGKFPADAQAVTTPEKRVPPKRASKAGKRAQAIRGGNASAKPLTIAEIRARTAAASGSSSNAPTTPTNTGSSSFLLKSTSRSPNATVSDAARQASSSLEPKSDRPLDSEGSSSARDQNKVSGRTSSTATADARDDSKSLLKSKSPAPTSTFDFRMSSAVTLRLRELRSQLDKATRHLSDTVRQGDPRSVAQSTIQRMPRVTRSPSQHSRENRMANGIKDRNDQYLASVPPSQHQLDQQQSVKSKQQASQRPSKSEGSSPHASMSPAREGTLTPTRDTQHRLQSTPAAFPKTTSASASPGVNKASKGRRTASHQTLPHKHGAACKHGHAHGHSRPRGTGSALFTDDDWICVFCEYELYYGETPLMLRACRNRKKLVEKKSKVKSKAQAALQKKSTTKANASPCPHDHHHDYDPHHHEHDCSHEYAHDCDHTCPHDHSSVSGSDDCCHHDHDHDHIHGHGGDRGKDSPHRASPQPRPRRPTERNDEHRERCDCGNSIHSSDFGDEDK